MKYTFCCFMFGMVLQYFSYGNSIEGEVPFSFEELTWEQCYIDKYGDRFIGKALKSKENKHYNQAARYFKKIEKKSSSPSCKAYAALAQAWCMEQKGKLWKSFRHYKRAIDQYPSHIPYIQILKRENDLAYYYDKEYRKRFLFFSLKGNDKATQIYQHIADAGVDLQFTPQAMYRLAFLHQENHDSEAAMVQFRELISEYPDHSLSTDARIELGRILIDKVKFQIDRGITKEAYRFVSPVANQSPHHPRIEEAKELLESIRVIEAERLLYLAKFYQRKAHKRNEVSRRYLTNLLENYRQTSVTDKAEALLITIK